MWNGGHAEGCRPAQEDFAQAFGAREKYQKDGGPSLKDCFERSGVGGPALWDQVMFAWLTGDEDKHAKNFSIQAELAYMTKGKGEPDDEGILEALQKEDHGFEAVRGFDHKSSQGIVVEHKKYLTIGYRGTDEWRDWLDNIDIERRHEDEGTFHEGFWEATQDIWKEMRRAVDEARERRRHEANPSDRCSLPDIASAERWRR